MVVQVVAQHQVVAEIQIELVVELGVEEEVLPQTLNMSHWLQTET